MKFTLSMLFILLEQFQAQTDANFQELKADVKTELQEMQKKAKAKRAKRKDMTPKKKKQKKQKNNRVQKPKVQKRDQAKKEIATMILNTAERAAKEAAERSANKAAAAPAVKKGPQIWKFAQEIAKQSLMDTEGLKPKECGAGNDRNSPLFRRAQDVLEQWRNEAVAQRKKELAEMQKPNKKQPPAVSTVVASLDEAKKEAEKQASSSSSSSSSSSESNGSSSSSSSSSDSESSCRSEAEIPRGYPTKTTPPRGYPRP